MDNIANSSKVQCLSKSALCLANLKGKYQLFNRFNRIFAVTFSGSMPGSICTRYKG